MNKIRYGIPIGIAAGLLALGMGILDAWSQRMPKPEVDLALVLAIDSSRSVTPDLWNLQVQGYADALVSKEVLRAIQSGATGAVAVTLVHFSGYKQQAQVVKWTMIRDEEGARDFVHHILTSGRPFTGMTHIGEAIRFSASLFADIPYIPLRKKIDVSGDGTDNSGFSPSIERDAAVIHGITINGLAVINTGAPYSAHSNPPGGLANYYRKNVAGGPGSFVLEARGFSAFGASIHKKLVLEIASR